MNAPARPTGPKACAPSRPEACAPRTAGPLEEAPLPDAALAGPGQAGLCSVIVPLYGHAAYIEACLDSVAAQTHRALELIVIDDASPDASHAVAERWLTHPARAGRFERSVLLRQPFNQGAHAALNRGLGLARGEWIALLNSDDLYASRRLERLIGALETQGRRFGFSRVRPFSDSGTPAHPGFWQLLNFIAHVAPRLPSLSLACLAHNCALTTGNFVLHRHLARQLGAFAPLPLAHDWDYLLRACTLTEPLLLPEPLYGYRLHPANTFSQIDTRAAVEREVCVGRYLRRVAAGAVAHPLAASPEHWPGLFEHVLERWGWLPLWERLGESSVTPSPRPTGQPS